NLFRVACVIQPRGFQRAIGNMTAQNHNNVRVNQRVLNDQPLSNCKKDQDPCRGQCDQNSSQNQPAAGFRFHFSHSRASCTVPQNSTCCLRTAATLFLGLVKSPGEEEVVVPLGTVLATKGPQQQKWKNRHFEQPAPVRGAHVQTLAKRAAPQQIDSSVRHNVGADSES